MAVATGASLVLVVNAIFPDNSQRELMASPLQEPPQKKKFKGIQQQKNHSNN